MELVRPDINLDFVGRRKLAYLVSGLLILMTVLILVVRGGPNYGIDFAGGVLVQVRFAQPTKAQDIKQALAPIEMGDSLVQRFGTKGDEFLIRTEKAGLKLEGLSQKVEQALKAVYHDKFEVRRVEMVGPKVGHDLRRKALMAIFYALILIAVYISGRFEAKWMLAGVMAVVLVGAILLMQAMITAMGGGEGAGLIPLIVTALVVTLAACWFLRLRYALGAIVALIHDVIITVGVFSLLDKEFTLATVAAILTIIGYSLNDTIIVFDRIRENLRKSARRALGQVINESVNQTLSRTILTSGTTLIVLFCLFILGGGVIADFALALLVGVVVGTYSSVFVASPILLLLPEGKPGVSVIKRAPAGPSPAARREAPALQEVEVEPGQTASQTAARRKRSKKSKRGGKAKRR